MLVIGLLYAGRAFFIPVTLAALVSALLRPVVRWLERRHVPTALGATVVILLTISVLGAVAWGLSVPVQGWAERIPQSVSAAQAKLAQLRRPMVQLTKIAQQFQNAGEPAAPQARGVGGAGGAGARQQPATPPPPSPHVAGYVAKALGTTESLVMGLVEVLL